MCRARNRLQLAAVSERNGILLVVSLSFLAGCLSALRLTGGIWLWGLAGLSLLMGWLLRRLGAGAGIALAFCFFALGALRFQSAYFTPQPDPGTYEITGYVYGGASERPDQRVAFVLGDVALDGAPASGTAYCTLHYDDVPPVLFDGAQVRFEGRVYLPDGKSGEPHMDFALWMRQSGQSFGIAAYQGIAVLNGEADAPVRDVAYRVRQSFTRALERVMGEEARVAVALLLGERDGLSQQEREAFETLGVAHVMSVSGLHVGLLGGLLLGVMRRLRVRRVLRLPAVFLAELRALTGFPPPRCGRRSFWWILRSWPRIFRRLGAGRRSCWPPPCWLCWRWTRCRHGRRVCAQLSAMLGITLLTAADAPVCPPVSLSGKGPSPSVRAGPVGTGTLSPTAVSFAARRWACCCPQRRTFTSSRSTAC